DVRRVDHRRPPALHGEVEALRSDREEGGLLADQKRAVTLLADLGEHRGQLVDIVERGPAPQLDLLESVEVHRGDVTDVINLAGLPRVRRGRRQREARREEREEGKDARSHRLAASLAERAPPASRWRDRGGCPNAWGVVPCEGS